MTTGEGQDQGGGCSPSLVLELQALHAVLGPVPNQPDEVH